MIDRNFINRLKAVDINNKEIHYNFLDVIRKSDNENIISDWLSFLLDPQKCGSILPLKLLCNHLDIEFLDCEIKIEREYTLDNRRRIDIIIKLKNAWIVIENKINSMECNKQTVDYNEKISNTAKNQNISLRFVYLKPTYNKSNPTNKKFKIVTYGELAEIWNNVKPDDFTQKENYVYFGEFIKLISERYAMSKEIQFDENTNLYIEFRDQFNAIEKSYDNACKIVKEKLLILIKSVFPSEEGWLVSPHSEYILFYKENWGWELHFEIGTWEWQKNSKNISFERLIANSVEIQYCLHAERKQATFYRTKFYEIEQNNSNLFNIEKYNFGNEDNCILSLNAIRGRLQNIKDSITPIIDNILTEDKK